MTDNNKDYLKLPDIGDLKMSEDYVFPLTRGIRRTHVAAQEVGRSHRRGQSINDADGKKPEESPMFGLGGFEGMFRRAILGSMFKTEPGAMKSPKNLNEE